MSKPWIELSADAIARLPAQLGVYELAADDQIIKIGYAGGLEPFGMRSALTAELANGHATHFRHEFTHGYLTRWQELLMVHHSDHGCLPAGNADRIGRIGHLSIEPPPAGSPSAASVGSPDAPGRR